MLVKCTLWSLKKEVTAKEGFLFIHQGCVLHLHNMISEVINGTRNKCMEGSANELCRTGKGSIFLQKIWIYILGERKVVEFFSNEKLNKEILDHISPPTFQNLLRCLQISF